MGADAKRREARKRRFKTVQDIPEGLLSKARSHSKHGVAPTKKLAKSKDDADTSNGHLSVLLVELHFPILRDNSTNSIIGNLPFTATETSVAQHFAKLRPIAIRHRTTKEAGKSRGFAFVEFDGYDRMKTCLQMYHHSVFDDGLSPVRKINVELTAGGGGAKSEERKSKISIKNERLDEQRKRRALEDGKAALSIAASSNDQITTPADESAIHPSRRKLVTRG
ncbi:hypothetical protein MMC11_007123 [Xylographa trunciseda]|nr:hypothetical protein [Xylographa trunciseda]